MKKRIFTILLLALVVCVWLLWHHKQPAAQIAAESPAAETNHPDEINQIPAAPTQAQNKQAIVSPAASEPTPESNPAAWIEMRRKQIEEEVQKGVNEWRTPIEFFGMVVDENTNAVSGVEIDFSCNDTSPTGNSRYHATSDANGLFSINNAQGKLLVVRLSKPGYYTSKRDNDSFEYGDRYAHFVPDAANPVIFRLKKKGVTEPLVHIQAPMGGAKGFRVARDGTAVEVSLVTGKTVSSGQGDLRVQCWTDDQSKPRGEKYDWKCQITVPKGGIVQNDEEFPFQAPLAGYQPSNRIDMPANLETGWSRSAKRNYFVKLANGTYARLSFEMVAGGDHFFQVESFLNLSGSRNLEFDPQIAINP